MSDRLENNSATAEPLPIRSVAQKSALFALRFYKTYLSMFSGGSCRFEPTCSIYAYQAVERFGVARGSWLALKRLLRCQPLSRKFGYDPVPDALHASAGVTPEEAHS
jgi:putative membrane protein insertion efficiency factor